MSYVKVYKYKKQVSYDQGETWEDTGEYAPSGEPIGYYDTLEECMTVYRTIQSGTTCVGYDKHNQDVYEVSYDNGATWSVVSTSAGTLIEADSPDCGYVPPTPTSPKYILTLQDSSTVSAECDSTSAITTAETSDYSFDIISATIGDCVTSIGAYTFYGCNSLTSVTIPNSVTSIGNDAFELCYILTSVTIPNSVTNIGNEAFYNCNALANIVIPSGVTSIGSSVFYNCRSLSSITIPDSVTSIGGGAFQNCSALTTIDIPSGVTSIGGSAFRGCSGLTSITIPNSVTSIGSSAFRDCSSLASITVNAVVPPTLGSNVFYNNNAPIYVPCDSLSAYQSAWSAYASRLQCITKQKKYLFEGSESFAQWYVARFSKSEGFLQVYFEHDINGIMDYLYGNNEPLYVEFSSVPESGTLCLQDGSWSTIFDAALPVSTSEPLQIYITDSTMYNVIYTHDLALIDKASNGFTITKVYYYE